MNACVKLTVTGRVQGVGFRWFVLREAEKLQITGYVKNLRDGSVEVLAEGNKNTVEDLIRVIKKGPTFSLVDEVVLKWVEISGKYNSFKVEL